jgi:hypothetical protein
MLAKSPNRKRAVEYLHASGAVPISIIERDGVCSISTGKLPARRVSSLARPKTYQAGHRSRGALCGLPTGEPDA